MSLGLLCWAGECIALFGWRWALIVERRVKNGDPSQKVPNSFLSPVAAAIHLYSDEPIVRPAPVVTAERLVQEPASAEAPVSEDGIILGVSCWKHKICSD